MSRLTPPASSSDQSQGPANAPVTLVEYGDYQCPSCGAGHLIVKKLQRHFGDRLRFIYRDFPLPMHPYAPHAAEAAAFAAANGQFWPMHDLLYKHQRDLSDPTLLDLAAQLNLNPAELEQALNDGTYTEAIQGSIDSGDASGVQGTPTFFINGQEHTGDYDFESLAQAIEAAASSH